MVTIVLAKTGFGIKMSDSSVGAQSFRWNGHGFSPSQKDQGWDDNATDWYDKLDSINPSNSFDLTNFRPGYEVVMFLVITRTDENDSNGNYTMKFEDDSGNTLFSYNTTYETAPVGLLEDQYSWIAIGFRPSPYNEISYNGTYYAKITGDISHSHSFTVSNLDTSLNSLYQSESGKIWVDGENLYYISKMGHIGKILHDGNSYGSRGTDNAGQIWVPGGTSGLKYLSYIDENGIERRTKDGTYYLDTSDNSITTGSTSDSGSISMSDNPNWTSIKFRAADGNLIQLGQGCLYTNMY